MLDLSGQGDKYLHERGEDPRGVVEGVVSPENDVHGHIEVDGCSRGGVEDGEAHLKRQQVE